MAETVDTLHRNAVEEAVKTFDINWDDWAKKREMWGREQLGQSILRGYWALRCAYVGAQVARLEALVMRSEHKCVIPDETITSIEQWVVQPLIDFIDGEVVVSEEEWRRIADGTLELDTCLAGAQEDIGDRLPLRVVRQTHQGDTTLVFEKSAETPEA